MRIIEAKIRAIPGISPINNLIAKIASGNWGKIVCGSGRGWKLEKANKTVGITIARL
jgi:hypothetical protein